MKKAVQKLYKHDCQFQKIITDHKTKKNKKQSQEELFDL